MSLGSETFYSDPIKEAASYGIKIVTEKSRACPTEVTISVPSSSSLKMQRLLMVVGLAKLLYKYKEEDSEIYAMDFLIPTSKLEFLIYDKGVKTVDDLSEVFVVPPFLIIKKLKSINVLT